MVVPQYGIFIKGNRGVEMMNIVVILVNQRKSQVHAVRGCDKAAYHGSAFVNVVMPGDVVRVVWCKVKGVSQAGICDYSRQRHKNKQLRRPTLRQEIADHEENEGGDTKRFKRLILGAGKNGRKVSIIIMKSLRAPEEGLHPKRALAGAPVITDGES